MDFTPGIFETQLNTWSDNQHNVHSTLTGQLALYLVMWSPLQMAADLPENYARFMDAFQFIRDVAVDWDKSLYLEAEPGEYIVTARHPKLATLNSGRLKGHSSVYDFVYTDGRPHDVWYVGGITGEEARDVEVKLDFLQHGLQYEATIYADAPDADYKTNPQAYTITKQRVDASSTLHLRMASSGGFAVSLREL